MKTLFAASLLALAGLAASAPAAAHPHGRGIEARQHAQAQRIGAGVAQGQLTRCEAARLSHRAARIERREQAYRASAGLAPWERRDLNRRLDSLSRDIREQRVDGNGCF
jgi:opacity protein-like surface antigen